MPLTKEDAVQAVGRVTAVPTILRHLTHVTGMRLSLVAQVTDRRWVCCAVNDELGFGLSASDELDLDTTLCKEVREAQKAIVIRRASTDPTYAQHRTPKMYGFESYVSVPIFGKTRGYFGNLCALDSLAIDLPPQTLATFEAFADLIGAQLETEEALASTSQALTSERATAELREQFIAVLGHDLRSPLAAILGGARLLQMKYGDERAVDVISRSAMRMSTLVDDLLDFARGRLGSGMSIALVEVDDVAALVRGVVDQARLGASRPIELDEAASGGLRCDRSRVEQALTNLVANALQHGNDEPIRVTARPGDGHVTIAVTNGGPGIPPARLAEMFQPFKRATTSSSRAGLGLGLYIVNEIARAHRGQITYSPEGGKTTFTLTLPRDPEKTL